LNDSSKTRLVLDIENRLDDFFGPNTEQSKTHVTSIEKLKSIILSIDWEITDGCLTDLINEAEELLPRYEIDRMTHALLRMLRSLGRYIQKRKAQAHPDAIKRMLSVFDSFEKIVNDQNIEDNLKRKILSKEINAFKKLKQQVDIQRHAVSIVSEKRPQHTGFIDHQKLEQAMSAVEQKLLIEVEALRNQIDILQQELHYLRKS
jgi:signal transduction protein with GAF and PtsI domain